MKKVVISADGNRKVYSVPDEKSVLIENLGWIDVRESLPAPYDKCPEFNF